LETRLIQNCTSFSYLRLFLALSRTTHAVLDIAAPAAAALMWLQAFPPLTVIVTGLATALAGYLAVYALNDVMDFRTDRKKIKQPGNRSPGFDLDALYIRHPLAQGLLSYKEGVIWSAVWGFFALLGAYSLNPACALIFIISILLETIYCIMLQVTYLRAVVSGIVKTMGPIAAVFAVDPQPSFAFLSVLFLWLFFWEIGGQNIPNDWADAEEDTLLKAETIPVKFGLNTARIIILITLFCSVGISVVLSIKLHLLCRLLVIAAGYYFLIFPSRRLTVTQTHSPAAVLFNRASYYPLAILIIVILNIIFF
jgi:4-hydroxybenzoate polyprenyltransferase